MSRVEQHRHSNNHWFLWLLGGLIIIGILVSVISNNAEAMPSNSQLTTTKTTKRKYILNGSASELYKLTGTNRHPHLRIVHRISNSSVVWTRMKQATVQQHGKTVTYYSVTSSDGRTGWILASKLIPATVKLNVPVISQRPELPTGCEITATTMMLRYAGANVTKMQMAKAMPRSSDPNQGFVGDPFSDTSVGMYIYPNGLMGLVKKELGSAKNMTGASLIQVKRQLARHHPVTAWVVNLDGFATHCITLSGYSQQQIYYSDPWTGKRKSLPNQAFLQDWQLNKRRALSY